MKTLDYLAAPLAALKAGDANKAIRMLEEIAVVHPEVVETPYHLARAYEKSGDAVRARELYAEVVTDGGHPFFSHAQNRLNELGGPPTSAAQLSAPVDEPVAAPEEPLAAVEQVPELAPEVAEAPAQAADDAEAAPAADDAAVQADSADAADASGEAAKHGGKKKKK